jgi:predicted nucleic acid-binding protein
VSRIFFDTNVFIYLFEGAEPFRSKMLNIRRRMIERGDLIVTSTMTLAEILVKPTRLGRISLVEEYDRAVHATAQVVPFDTQAARRFASLRGTYKLRSADAIQLACAAHAGVDLFLTNDMALHPLNIPGIGFITPLDKVPL